MSVIMDGLLIAGTFFAGIYCWVLARRVQALKSLDQGLGGAIVTLTRQIELARATLDEARSASTESRRDLVDLIARSESASGQLRLLLVASKEPLARAKAARPAAESPAERASRYHALLQPAIETEADPAPPAQAEVPPREPISARRRDGLGPRLVSLPQIAAPSTVTEAVPAPDAVPKPRRTQSLEAMIRRRLPAETAPRNEEDLLAALSAIAAGGER